MSRRGAPSWGTRARRGRREKENAHATHHDTQTATGCVFMPAAMRRGACPDGSPALMERRTREAGDPRVRAGHYRPGELAVLTSGGAHRHVRSGWDAVG